MKTKNHEFKENAINKDKLEKISGGYWPWEGVYIVTGMCTGCGKCSAKCLALVIQPKEKARILPCLCKRCSGCVDHGWCEEGAIQWEQW